MSPSPLLNNHKLSITSASFIWVTSIASLAHANKASGSIYTLCVITTSMSSLSTFINTWMKENLVILTEH